jgi:hypothetical protein
MSTVESGKDTYRVLYRSDGNAVYIVAIPHAARLLGAGNLA